MRLLITIELITSVWMQPTWLLVRVVDLEVAHKQYTVIICSSPFKYPRLVQNPETVDNFERCSDATLFFHKFKFHVMKNRAIDSLLDDAVCKQQLLSINSTIRKTQFSW